MNFPNTDTNLFYPKISIVTPSFNQGKYLEETILSVLEQNYPNLEYIIIDGGSSDNSVEIIKKYEHKLAYWISEKDAGMYDAIQKGFEKSTGEIMAWINSDDKYHPNAFFSVAEVFSTFRNVEWLSGASCIYNEKGYAVNISKSRILTALHYLSGDRRWIQQESTFFKQSLWIKAGSYVDKSLGYAGDFELWFRFFKYAKRYCCDMLIGGFRQRTSNQKSLEGMDIYLKEVDEVLSREKISFKIKCKIIFLRCFNLLFMFAQKKSFLRRLYLKLIDTPEKIYFDRKTQSFKK